VLSYYVSLHSEFRVVMSVTISAQKPCSFPLKPQLFVGGLISYLRFLYLHAYRVVSNAYCVVFCLSSSCVFYVASFCRFLIVHSVFSNVYWQIALLHDWYLYSHIHIYNNITTISRDCLRFWLNLLKYIHGLVSYLQIFFF